MKRNIKKKQQKKKTLKYSVLYKAMTTPRGFWKKLEEATADWKEEIFKRNAD